MLAYLKKWTVGALLLLCAASAYSAPKTVLVLGDSLSAEYGLARGAGWVALLEQKLKSEKIDASIVNASISGETTSGGRTRLPALLDKYHPSIVVIELGANDGLRGLPVPAAEDNLLSMVRLARQNKAKVLLVGMRMPPNYGRAYTERFFGMYKQVSSETKAWPTSRRCSSRTSCTRSRRRIPLSSPTSGPRFRPSSNHNEIPSRTELRRDPFPA
jgi:acyl-CoA thioesterase-1